MAIWFWWAKSVGSGPVVWCFAGKKRFGRVLEALAELRNVVRHYSVLGQPARKYQVIRGPDFCDRSPLPGDPEMRFCSISILPVVYRYELRPESFCLHRRTERMAAAQQLHRIPRVTALAILTLHTLVAVGRFSGAPQGGFPLLFVLVNFDRLSSV